MLFSVAVIVFFVVTIILIRDFNIKRTNDYKAYSAAILNIVQQKNNTIRVLSNLLAEKEKENANLKDSLSDTRNTIDALSKRLAHPAPVAVSK